MYVFTVLFSCSEVPGTRLDRAWTGHVNKVARGCALSHGNHVGRNSWEVWLSIQGECSSFRSSRLEPTERRTRDADGILGTPTQLRYLQPSPQSRSRGGRHSERDACPGRVSAWGPSRFGFVFLDSGCPLCVGFVSPCPLSNTPTRQTQNRQSPWTRAPAGDTHHGFRCRHIGGDQFVHA